MHEPKWRVCLDMDGCCELHQATVYRLGDSRPREILKMITGPFDSPEEILATIIELIDHAEWRGEQLQLPATAAPE